MQSYYLEVSPTEYHRTYSSINVYRIAVLLFFSMAVTFLSVSGPVFVSKNLIEHGWVLHVYREISSIMSMGLTSR